MSGKVQRFPGWLERLEPVVAEIERRPTGFIFRGREYRDFPGSDDGNGKRERAVQTLATLLYNDVYSRPGGASANASAAVAAAGSGDPRFVEDLSRANRTRELTDPGWSVQSVRDGIVTATRNSATRALGPEQYRADGKVEPGNLVTRLRLKESRHVQPGFYYAYSEEEFEFTPVMMRFYWNLAPGGASVLIEAVTHWLNRYATPFLFKCLNAPEAYVRCDPAVLFVKRQYLHVCCAVLPELVAAAGPFLRSDVPLLTLRIAPGVGFAENPAGMGSFGLSRMDLVARGLLAAMQAGRGGGPERVAEIARHFHAMGIDPARPFLNRDSNPQYIESLSAAGRLAASKMKVHEEAPTS